MKTTRTIHPERGSAVSTETIASPALTDVQRPPHMVIIVENMPVPADRRVWQEATALVQAGWRVSVICPKAGRYTKSHEYLEGVEIYRHSLPFEANGLAGYALEYGTALLMEIAALVRVGFGSIDVVQICNPPDFLFMPALLAKVFGKAKIIFDHHDLTPELLVEKTGKPTGPLLAFAQWAERKTFHVADHVISTNAAFQNVAIGRGNKKKEDTSVVYSAPDLARMPFVSANPALKKGASKLLLWVGMMGSQDGVDLLLQAMQILRGDLKETDAHLLIAGDGPERSNLIDDAERLGISDAVSFPGFLSGHAFAEAFCTADIGIGSDPKNDFNDQLAMNKVMEYMAYKLPIVMFDLAECRRIAGEAALIADDNDPASLAAKICTLLHDEEQATAMGNLGHARLASSFSWAQQKSAYIDACNKVLRSV